MVKVTFRISISYSTSATRQLADQNLTDLIFVFHIFTLLRSDACELGYEGHKIGLKCRSLADSSYNDTIVKSQCNLINCLYDIQFHPTNLVFKISSYLNEFTKVKRFIFPSVFHSNIIPLATILILKNNLIMLHFCLENVELK